MRPSPGPLSTPIAWAVTWRGPARAPSAVMSEFIPSGWSSPRRRSSSVPAMSPNSRIPATAATRTATTRRRSFRRRWTRAPDSDSRRSVAADRAGLAVMRSRAIWLALGVAGIVVALLGLAAWGAVAYTARPDFCASCHLMQTRYVSWKRSPHYAAATCIQCHSEPGLIGEVKAHLNGTRYLWVILTGDKSGTILRAAVSSATC